MQLCLHARLFIGATTQSGANAFSHWRPADLTQPVSLPGQYLRVKTSAVSSSDRFPKDLWRPERIEQRKEARARLEKMSPAAIVLSLDHISELAVERELLANRTIERESAYSAHARSAKSQA